MDKTINRTNIDLMLVWNYHVKMTNKEIKTDNYNHFICSRHIRLITFLKEIKRFGKM